MQPSRAAPNARAPLSPLQRTPGEDQGVQDLIPVVRTLEDVDLLVAAAAISKPSCARWRPAFGHIKFLGAFDHVSAANTLSPRACHRPLPSLCYETFGLIVAESFSTATPVIVVRAELTCRAGDPARRRADVSNLR